MEKTLSGENLRKHVCALTDGIGVRLAGSPQERQAAEYIRDEFLKYTPHVTIEEYPVNERYVTKESLEVLVDGVWQSFPCSLFSSAPSTDGAVVEAPIVYFDTFTGYQQPDISYLRGKAVVHMGCHFFSEDDYRRIMEAKPAFILFVDTRYPSNLPLADGLFPKFVEKYGSVPSLNVAYLDAWKWCTAKAPLARICVEGGMRKSTTTVVVAELPGTDPTAGVIYTGGHHDTQAGTVGADDNAIGSAACIEFARILSDRPHKRTFKLISFGAEEQLSVGSASYVRRHRSEIEKDGVFMLNVDSAGTAMGWGYFVINANPPLRKLITETFNRRGIYFIDDDILEPFTDQFPFAACMVPGCWISRQNCTSGMFYHHRIDNTPDKIDYEILASYVSAATEFLEKLSDTEDIEQYKGFPEKHRAAVLEQFEAIFGGF